MGAAALPLALMGVSTGLQIFGGIQQAKALREQGRAQQRYYHFLADQNEADAAKILKESEQQVTAIQDAGARETAGLKRVVSEVRGAQATTLAASGVGGGSVTAEDIARDTLRKENMDEMVIRFNADSRAYETRKSAVDKAHKLRVNAIFNRMGGANVNDASRRDMVTSLLDTATSVGSNWASWYMRK
jgi:hypothetical protein